MKAKTAKELLEKVEADYSKIASEFDETRKWLWPEFDFFKKHLKNDLTILDFGCGNGRLYEFFEKVNYIGIDNNKEFIKIAQKNYPSAKFVLGNLIQMPSTYQADLIFSIASFHHVPSLVLRKKSIHVLKQNLKHDGLLILFVWNLFQKKYIKYIFKSIFKFVITFGKYDWNDTFIPWGKSDVKRYYHAFTPNELKRLFNKNGFEILEMFYTRKGKKVSFLKSHNICLVCKKK
jgi:SAM-dependent methyltransferase